MKKKLQKEVWGKSEYYDLAKEGSLNFTHPAMKLLNPLSTKATKILDLGCGEGTRLNHFCKRGKELVGVDISSTAIKKAKEQYPMINFVSGDLEKLPLKDESFDLVYSAFVLEHLDNPEKAITEAVRVLEKDGDLVLVAPNYGAPNRSSPPFKGSRISKLISGFIKDLVTFNTSSLNWNKVKPLANNDVYKMDWDTTVEPYLGSLISFLKQIGLTIELSSSCWDQELKGAGLLQSMIAILGKIGIYPFKYWGPHLLVYAKK